MVEYLVSLKIEKLEEGMYLATSDDLQGLVAQGRTISDTVEIAQDVARNLIESHLEHGDPLPDGIAPATKPVQNLEIPVTVSV